MELSKSILTNNFDLVNSTLEKKKEYSSTELAVALTFASSCADIKIIELLIQHGADVNYVLEDRTPPLLNAVEHERPDIIKLLLDHGANINLKDSMGNTALQLALDKEIVSASESGESPKMELSKLLFKMGADPRLKDGTGKTALDDAKDGNHLEALKLFTENKA